MTVDCQTCRSKQGSQADRSRGATFNLGRIVLASLLLCSLAFGQTNQPTQEVQGKRVSNVFQDTDLKQALSDLGTAAGVVIVPDETVQGNVTAQVKNVTIEEALNVLLLPGGYSWTKIGDAYLVGKADPTSPNFLRFASSRIYKPNFTTADRLCSLLPTAMSAYVKSNAGERTITITAAPIMMDRIMKDVKMLDVPPIRVLLEAMVTEAKTSTLNQYDLSFVWKTFGLSSDATLPSMQFQYTKVSQSDVATMKALIANGQASIKANPRVMTIEGKEASIEVGQENYFEVVSGPVNFPYTTLQQIKTGISLKMTPYVSDDGQITVQLAPEVSDATGSGPGGLPINTVRRASTMVRVKNGETIVIGGMTFQSIRKRHSKIPILGDLPLIGSLFRFIFDESDKQDVIIMVTPRIIRDGEEHAEDIATGVTNSTTIGESKKSETATKPARDAVKCKPVTATHEPHLVSINHARLEELAAVSGLGRLYASRIIDYRGTRGPFKSLDDILNVPGLNSFILDAVRDRLKL